MTTVYRTRAEVIDLAILPALGEHAAEYDVEAILDRAFRWIVDANAAGEVRADLSGFRQTASTLTFWGIVHDCKLIADQST